MALTGLGLAALWAYWTTLSAMATKWEESAEYSHGWLVPFFCLILIWLRRPHGMGGTMLTKAGVVSLAAAVAAWLFGPTDQWSWLAPAAACAGIAGGMVVLADCLPARPSPSWIGLMLILAGAGLRVFAAQVFMEWFDQLSLVAVAFGIVLLVGGWTTLRWAWPAVGFLIFMVPLPHRLEVSMRDPLRRVGTIASTYVLQGVNIPAFAEGNVIVVPRPRDPGAAPATAVAEPVVEVDPEGGAALTAEQEAAASGEIRIGVVEACSGLRMLMIFFALSAAMALLADRPIWQKWVILLAAVPIALASNVLRILSTAVLHIYGYDHLADLAFHDLAGWLMMPIGLGMLWVLLWYLDRLFVVEEDRPMSAGLVIQRPATAAEAATESETRRELQESIR